MSDFTFVHAADIHLDSPLIGLSSHAGAPVDRLRGATRRALSNLVDLAVSEGAKFLVLSGDLYDGRWRDMRTGLFAVAEFARAVRHGVRIFIVHGNHDAESKITRHLPMPEGVRVFGTRACETAVLDDLGVAIHGQSFKHAATSDNLAARYCPPTQGLFNIALLHTALEGGHAHANYAPCSADALAASGHDYWALGHVHEYRVHRAYPHIVYPGNTQGRHVRETGPKGAVLVRVEAGRVCTAEFRALDDIRWASIVLDTTDCADRSDVFAALREQLDAAAAAAAGRPLAARVSLTLGGRLGQALGGEAEWLDAEVRALGAAAAEAVWIEKVKLIAPAGSVALPGALEELLAGAEDDPDCLRAIQAALEPLLNKLPHELTSAEATPLLAAARGQQLDQVLEAARRALSHAFNESAE